jgi:hypothetical protein
MLKDSRLREIPRKQCFFAAVLPKVSQESGATKCLGLGGFDKTVGLAHAMGLGAWRDVIGLVESVSQVLTKTRFLQRIEHVHDGRDRLDLR